MKGFCRFIAVLLVVVGAGAVWAAVEPLPGTPLEVSALAGLLGFALIFVGHFLWQRGGGPPIIDLS